MEEDGGRASKSLTRFSSRRSSAQDNEPPRRSYYKRLIVCCDGTWLDSTGGLEHGEIPPASNVTRITRAIRSESRDGIPQIVYYQAGIGSQGNVATKVIGGATAAGLSENVREAYGFIANNYTVGDEIFLLGFSRGAFTVRSVAGLIGHIGVLTKSGMASFPVVYKDFTHRYDKSYRSPLPDTPIPNKPNIRNPAYIREMEKRGLTTLGVRIRAIGVWDTVGALGVPKLNVGSSIKNRFSGQFSVPFARNEPSSSSSDDLNEYAFYDTRLDDCVDNAFQALALDEKRQPFQPALWEKRGNEETNLIQVWFPGVHTNVGGGYPDQELANISLAWMIAMLAPLLEVSLEYVISERRLNEDFYDEKGKRPRPWSFGKIYDSSSGLFSVSGTKSRTPGEYMRTDPRTGEPTRKPLRDTNEYIHSSVRARYDLEGPGYDRQKVYNPSALKDWSLRTEDVPGLPTPFYWDLGDSSGTVLPEAPLRTVEKMLLGESPDIEDYVLRPPQRKSRRP